MLYNPFQAADATDIFDRSNISVILMNGATITDVLGSSEDDNPLPMPPAGALLLNWLQFSLSSDTFVANTPGLPTVHSNHELDRFLKSLKLLILRSY